MHAHKRKLEAVTASLPDVLPDPAIRSRVCKFCRNESATGRKRERERERERERKRYTSAWSNNCWKNNNCFYRREYIATVKPASPRLVQHVISSTFDYFRTFFRLETFRLEFVWLTKILPLELIFLTIFI